ncbi:MAG: RNA polymerase sigma factor [Rubrivivax sp.]
MVRAQLRRLLGDDPVTADDLAQETFVMAWRKLEQFRGDSRFSTWLYSIAHSCFLQFLRSKSSRVQHEVPDPDSVDAIRAAPGDPELGLDLAAALKQLSTNQRAAVLYCVQMGLSHDEAAQVLDMPLGSVKTHVARGKARLRELLHDWAPNDKRSDIA